jgi:hypothetical protein
MKQCSAPAGWHWLDRPSLSEKSHQHKKSIDYDHEIIENGIICLNLSENGQYRT